MIDVFISRDLNPNHHFRQYLLEKGLQVAGQSLVQFRPLAFDPPAVGGWRFFYSPRGVQYYFDRVQNEEQPLAAMGTATAQAIENAGHRASFIGQGQPEAVARQFSVLAQGQPVVFVQAAHSRQSVETLLQDQVQVISLPVYANEPVPAAHLPEAKVVLLTSPLNTRAYFSFKTAASQTTYIAIGPSTAGELARHTSHYFVSPAPDEIALAEFTWTVYQDLPV